MTTNPALYARSQAFADELLADLLAAEGVPTTPRQEATLAAAQLAFEHAMALRLLFQAQLPSAAVVLLRAQYESLLRAAWLLYACGAKYLLLSALLYVPGAMLYAWARRQHGWALLSRAEWVACAGLLGAGVVALSGLQAGWLSL